MAACEHLKQIVLKTDKLTDKLIDKLRERQTERKTGRQTERQTDRQTVGSWIDRRDKDRQKPENR